MDVVDPDDQNHVDGGIFLYRQSSKAEDRIKKPGEGDTVTPGTYTDVETTEEELKTKKMEYLPYDEFMELFDEVNALKTDSSSSANSKRNKLKYSFTIDKTSESGGNLLVVEITSKTEQAGFQEIEDNGSWFEGTLTYAGSIPGATIEYEVTLKNVDYTQYVSKYAMTYEFLINLCEITQNPEYVYHVALLARDTQIKLTLMDTTIEKVTTEEQTVTTETYEESIIMNPAPGTGDSTQTTRSRRTSRELQETPKPIVEFADAWTFYEENKIVKDLTISINTGTPESQDLEEQNLEEIPGSGDPIDGVPQVTKYQGTLIRDISTASQTVEFEAEYKTSEEPIISIEKSRQFLGLLRCTEGECINDCYVEKAKEDEDPVALECALYAEFDKKGTNTKYRIPGMTKEEMPLNRLTSGISMLYAALQNNTKGYDEKLATGEVEVGEGDEFTAADEYVSKMQLVVEHLRKLMLLKIIDEDEYDYERKRLTKDGDLEDDERYEIPEVPSDYMTPDMEEVARKIYEFLIAKGLTPEAACAILGNIEQESSFNPAANNGNHHFGLCQWGGSRWQALKNLAASRGVDWFDLDLQLDFLWDELMRRI